MNDSQTTLQNLKADALQNIQRFLLKYDASGDHPIALADVLRFRINALLASEPEQLTWLPEDTAEIAALLQAYQHMLEIERKNLAELQQRLQATPPEPPET